MPPSVTPQWKIYPGVVAGGFFMRTLISIVPVDGIVNFCLPVSLPLKFARNVFRWSE